MKSAHFILGALMLIQSIPCNPMALSWADTKLAALSLDEKIGQLFMITALAGDPKENEKIIAQKPYRMDPEYIEQAIATYHPGGIIYLGKNDPKLMVMLTEHYQNLSATPLLIGMDFEWGLAMRLKNTIAFPRAMTLGAITDDCIIEDIAYEIGTQARMVGAHIVFAPVVDTNTNPENPIIGMRSFGDCPAAVARKGIAYMRGLQTAGILSCAKHFPGHGDTSVDSHCALPCIMHSTERVRSIEMQPFHEMIRAGVPAVMVAHIAVPAFNADPHLPATISSTLITDILKKEFEFKGLVVTDGLDMHGITKGYGAESGLLALRAGCDILLCPPDLAAAHAQIKDAVLNGHLDEKDLDAHVLKILAAKEKITNNLKPAAHFSLAALHTKHAYKLKQKAFDAAITVIGNQTLIPLPCHACSAYVHIGNQETEENLCVCALKNYLDLTVRYLSLEEINPVVQEHGACAVIVAIYPSAGADVQKIALSYLAALREEHIPSIAIIYGSPYQAKPFIKLADTTIIAYEDMPEAHASVGNLVIGKLKAQGVLPVVLP